MLKGRKKCKAYQNDLLDVFIFYIIFTVVDSYSAWCGPCKAIVSSFKRLKNELGDDLLVFATVSFQYYDYYHFCYYHHFLIL